MAFCLRSLAIITFMITGATLTAAQTSGSGTTTRYWDCCKPSCAWNDLSTLGIQSAVKTCDVTDKPITDTSAASGCNGGTAYMCSDQSPWIVGTNLAYGFASVSASGSNCCQCYQLTFTSGAVAGKKMIVQATNTGTDVGSTQFDIAMPGGGFGIFNGCSTAWGATSAVWGAQYGGPSTDKCSSFPDALKAGCKFRWDKDFFAGSDNPTVNWEKVSCPAAITAKSGCVRIGDGSSGDNPSSAPSAAPSSTTTAVSSDSAVVSSSTVVSLETGTTSTTAGSSSSASSTGSPVYTSLTGFVTFTVSSSLAAVETSSSTASSYGYSSVSAVTTSSTTISSSKYSSIAPSTYESSSSAGVATSSTVKSTDISSSLATVGTSTSTTSSYAYSSPATVGTLSSVTSTSVSSSVATAGTSSSATSTYAYSSAAAGQTSSSMASSDVYPTPVAASVEAPAKIAKPETDDDTCER